MTNSLHASQPPRRRYHAAQSLTVAIIVLFLLLFLGGLFIALIVNSLRTTQTAAKGNAADKLAEAGLKYLDDQLTRAPEGADWRPVPYVADAADSDSASGGGNYDDTNSNGNGLRNAEPLRTSDPDYRWLRPCTNADNSTLGPDEPCGYSRVEFGGRTASAGNLGGRALVKIVYRPDGTSPTSYALQLFAIGRSGIIDAADPTTFGNSESIGARRELLAFKEISLVRYIRQITNKDDRRVIAALGSPNQVLDTPYSANGARPTTIPVARTVESVFHGPIHSNAPLTFYGINRLLFNSQRGDTLTVSSNLNIPTGGGQVFLTSTGPIATNNTPVLPTDNAGFQTFQGLVRDNAPQEADPLRRVAKKAVPLIDEEIGESGLTRYRAITRESQPLSADQVTANPITLPNDRVGRTGWGAGLYLDNREDVQNSSAAMLGGYSPRANWTGADTTYWKGDNRYVPPAVVITLTPRYMMIQRSATSTVRSFLRDNTGRRINQTTVVRYSGNGDGSASPLPAAGLPSTVRRLEGYPAKRIGGSNIWEGDYVVYAEGNVRIRGTVGGLDPETLRYYIRHLTVVSGANIYIDGNLLKDNIPDEAVPQDAATCRGRSTLALLAKNYVVVNTTQFINPGDNEEGSESDSESSARAIVLAANTPNFTMRLNQGPAQTYNPTTGMPVARVAQSDLYSAAPNRGPRFYVRHSATGVNGSTAIRLGINNDFYRFPNNMAWPASNPPQSTLALGGSTDSEAGVYFDHVFPLDPTTLYPTTTQPYQGGGFPVTSVFGMDNFMAISLDLSAGVPNQSNYRIARFGIAPNDIRIEALIYAQEGSFFVIPGPWFNPDPNDTYEKYVELDPATGQPRYRRAGDNLASANGYGRIDPMFPFYGQPQDIRITVFGAITENLPAEVGDQAAWLEKWGWVPNYYGSTGLPVASGYDSSWETTPMYTVHGADPAVGSNSAAHLLPGPRPGQTGGGSGIVYLYDERLVHPVNGTWLRTDIFGNPLPAAPRLPVAPGLVYAGEVPGA